MKVFSSIIRMGIELPLVSGGLAWSKIREIIDHMNCKKPTAVVAASAVLTSLLCPVFRKDLHIEVEQQQPVQPISYLQQITTSSTTSAPVVLRAMK